MYAAIFMAETSQWKQSPFYFALPPPCRNGAGKATSVKRDQGWRNGRAPAFELLMRAAWELTPD
jgi:hypothetical protein